MEQKKYKHISGKHGLSKGYWPDNPPLQKNLQEAAWARNLHEDSPCTVFPRFSPVTMLHFLWNELRLAAIKINRFWPATSHMCRFWTQLIEASNTPSIQEQEDLYFQGRPFMMDLGVTIQPNNSYKQGNVQSIPMLTVFDY